MKILFLDIDGVLNSQRSCVAFHGFPHDFTPKDMGMFDMVAVGLIREACKETGCSIVLSSTWRKFSTAAETAAALDLPVIDCTPVLNKARGFEINAWLAEHPEVTSYVIVDDDSDMLDFQRPYFVQTDFQTGLSLENYAQIKQVLRTTEAAAA
jgi:hypothetical protein